MLEILFVSDYVCPYCIVAKEALKAALKELGLFADITWQPYELTEEPAERIDTYNDAARRERFKSLLEPAHSLGLDVKFPPNVVPRPYTRLAFEGYFYAKAHGHGDDYNDLIYKAYFIDEQDIGDLDFLCNLASLSGMDADDFRKALENGTYSRLEKEAVAYSKNCLKVKHVPTVYLNGKEIELKDYTKEEFMKILSE